MVHTATTVLVSYCTAAEHLLSHVIRVIFMFVWLFRNTSLIVTQHTLELLGRSLLFLCFQYIGIQMVAYFLF